MAKYADFDPEAQVRRMAGRVEDLLGAARQPTRPRDGSEVLSNAAVPAGVFC